MNNLDINTVINDYNLNKIKYRIVFGASLIFFSLIVLVFSFTVLSSVRYFLLPIISSAIISIIYYAAGFYLSFKYSKFIYDHIESFVDKVLYSKENIVEQNKTLKNTIISDDFVKSVFNHIKHKYTSTNSIQVQNSYIIMDTISVLKTKKINPIIKEIMLNNSLNLLKYYS